MGARIAIIAGFALDGNIDAAFPFAADISGTFVIIFTICVSRLMFDCIRSLIAGILCA